MNKKKLIHVKNIDEETLNQFNSCSKLNFVIKSALMPDAHNGYVAPIGSVFLTKEYFVPSWIGYDIGCGVLTSKLNKNIELKYIQKNSNKILNEVILNIPMGKGKLNHIQNISNNTKKEFKKILEKLKNLEKENYPKLFNKIKNNSLSNLGTLGSGNHFIELGIDSNKQIWCTIHTGSRNIGHIIAEEFMKIAEIESKKNNDKNILKKLNHDSKKFENNFELYYNSKDGKSYLNFHNFAIEFANLNRIEILKKIEKILQNILKIKEIELNIWANKPHNYLETININEFIHRKGATSSHLNEKGIIPANIKDGTYLIIGKGNKDFLYSSSHGAGRKLSRTEAKKKLDLEGVKKETKNIINNLNSVDEAPKAYKNINEILELQKETIKIINHIKPIINWKG